jgi:hypothetical protein
VTRIFGGDPVDAVFTRTSAAVERTVKAEVLSFNEALLAAISAGDWNAYEALTDSSITCFEPEAAADGLVRGTAFHKSVFEAAAAARAASAAAGKPTPTFVSAMVDPDVRLLGPRHALVTYTRVITPADAAPSAAAAAATRVSESRVWRLDGTAWKLVHFHRSRQ